MTAPARGRRLDPDARREEIVAGALRLFAEHPYAAVSTTDLAREVSVESRWPLLVAGGLLVGFGTRLGSGCTSGHGVCGMARGSIRSFAATAVFMAAAFATVYVARHLVGA